MTNFSCATSFFILMQPDVMAWRVEKIKFNVLQQQYVINKKVRPTNYQILGTKHCLQKLLLNKIKYYAWWPAFLPMPEWLGDILGEGRERLPGWLSPGESQQWAVNKLLWPGWPAAFPSLETCLTQAREQVALSRRISLQFCSLQSHNGKTNHN